MRIAMSCKQWRPLLSSTSSYVSCPVLRSCSTNNIILVLIYTVLLLVLSIIASSRGQNVWTSSVKESTFFAPSSGLAQPQVPLTQYSGSPVTEHKGAPPPQHLGNYNGYNGYNDMSQSPQMQPQQMSHPGYGGSPQVVPV